MAEIVKRLNETMAEVNEVSKFGRASRKRSSQGVDNFLPCKRYRLDMNVVGNNHAIGYESPTIKAINNRSNSKRLIKRGKSPRYYRPMFRLLRSAKVDTTIDADVSNILRQCKERALAREFKDDDNGLFGGSTSHSPACTFRGWTPAYKNINQLKSPFLTLRLPIHHHDYHILQWWICIQSKCSVGPNHANISLDDSEQDRSTVLLLHQVFYYC